MKVWYTELTQFVYPLCHQLVGFEVDDKIPEWRKLCTGSEGRTLKLYSLTEFSVFALI